MALMAVMSAIASLADGNELLAAFREAVANRDVLECQQAIKPLFDKAVTVAVPERGNDANANAR